MADHPATGHLSPTVAGTAAEAAAPAGHRPVAPASADAPAAPDAPGAPVSAAAPDGADAADTADTADTAVAPGPPRFLAAPGPPSPPPRRRGMSGTVADMVRSLGVLLVVIALVWFVSGMWHNSARGQTTVTDWQARTTDIPAAVGYEIEVPGSLPAGWSVSVVRLTDNAGAWTMTASTADGHYVDLLQSSGDLAAEQAAALPDARVTGPVRLGPVVWSSFGLPADERGNPLRALVRQVSPAALPTGASAPTAATTAPTPTHAADGPRTLLVLSGTATAPELATFATALHAVG